MKYGDMLNLLEEIKTSSQIVKKEMTLLVFKMLQGHGLELAQPDTITDLPLQEWLKKSIAWFGDDNEYPDYKRETAVVWEGDFPRIDSLHLKNVHGSIFLDLNYNEIHLVFPCRCQILGNLGDGVTTLSPSKLAEEIVSRRDDLIEGFNYAGWAWKPFFAEMLEIDLSED